MDLRVSIYQVAPRATPLSPHAPPSLDRSTAALPGEPAKPPVPLIGPGRWPAATVLQGRLSAVALVSELTAFSNRPPLPSNLDGRRPCVERTPGIRRHSVATQARSAKSGLV